MFSIKDSTKSILLCGPENLTQSFVFENAIHWAEEGHRVLYIAQSPLTSIPSKYHDRSNPPPTVFNMIRFVYVENYEALIEQLVELHMLATVPSVLLIDSLDKFIHDSKVAEQDDMHVARLCAIIHDTMNACFRLLNEKVLIVASVSLPNLELSPFYFYFTNIWHINQNSQDIIELKKIFGDDKENKNIFNYQKFDDGTIILNRILKKSNENCENKEK